jgi:hypothetical protein
MPPSDSLPPAAMALVPRADGLPRCGRLFCTPQGRRHVRPQRAVRRRRVTGSPPDRDGSRRGEGLPGAGTVLFIRAMVAHPAGDTPLLAQTTRMQRGVVAFRYNRTSASGKTRGFGAACPMAHLFARRRIADHISGIVARLTTGSGGLTLGRAGFAPAGRQTKFHEVIASSFPFDPHCLVALFFLYSQFP